MIGRRHRLALTVLLSGVLAAGLLGAGPVAAAPRAGDTTVTQLLNSLTVAPERSKGYDRDKFADWFSVNGCDTRERVLARQNLAAKGGTCGANRGRWFSAYDGRKTRNPSNFDIEHVVPLAEAWDSGAYRWTSRQRDRFANDLGYRWSLIAVSASSNRSKGEQDPAEWMPPRRSYGCKYLRHWVGVKYRWGLSVDRQEKAFLATGLASCKQVMARPPTAVSR